MLLNSFNSFKKSSTPSGIKLERNVLKFFANAGELPLVEIAIVRSPLLIYEGKIKSQYCCKSTQLQRILYSLVSK